MGQLYRANHHAVASSDEDDSDLEDYNRKLSQMRMIIGGVGAQSGYLMNWFTKHKAKPPPDMIGDLFLMPIDRNGRVIELNEEASKLLAPLRLRPTKAEINDFTRRTGHRSLVIVTEPKDRDGKPLSDKSEILDIGLKHGYITDCVLSGSAARRLLLKYKQSPKE